MSEDDDATHDNDHETFAREAEGDRVGLLAEFWGFLKHNKKWWLLPMLLVIAVLGLLMLLVSNPAAGPFIYPLF
ncbi:MAG: hypothetical protein JXQ75_13245 [Phycisphaerae bacterium]|nr:hypothetical protein [Phycisphaerae bacterium]